MSETQPIPLSDDERSELERLRAEVSRLREAPAEPAPPRERHWVRATAAAVVITLGCLLAPLSVAAVWTSTQLTDTDAYVETVTPLIEEPAVQRALAAAVTNEVFSRLDIEDRTTEALQAVADRTELPPLIEERLLGLAVPLTNGVEGFVADQVDFEAFFARAPRLNPNAKLITGVVCGVRVEDIDDPLMQKIRYLDKLIDELAKGRKMTSILRG